MSNPKGQTVNASSIVAAWGSNLQFVLVLVPSAKSPEPWNINYLQLAT